MIKHFAKAYFSKETRRKLSKKKEISPIKLIMCTLPHFAMGALLVTQTGYNSLAILPMLSSGVHVYYYMGFFGNRSV